MASVTPSVFRIESVVVVLALGFFVCFPSGTLETNDGPSERVSDAIGSARHRLSAAGMSKVHSIHKAIARCLACARTVDKLVSMVRLNQPIVSISLLLDRIRLQHASLCERSEAHHCRSASFRLPY